MTRRHNLYEIRRIRRLDREEQWIWVADGKNDWKSGGQALILLWTEACPMVRGMSDAMLYYWLGLKRAHVSVRKVLVVKLQ